MVAAVGSYLQAKHQTGKWLVRIEDLDPPRAVQGSASNILHTLEKFGLHWDETVCYQSQRDPYYLDALHDLTFQNLIYPCSCSRKSIQKNEATTGKTGLIYPGTCRHKKAQTTDKQALRVKVNDTEIHFNDIL